MCGGRATSVAEEKQFGQSEIDLHSGSTDTARNELKRPREVTNSSSKLRPVVPALAPKRHQMELPSQSNLICSATVTEAAADVDRNSASKAPPGVFDFPMPKSGAVFDIRQFYDVFFHSLVDGRSLIKPIEMEGMQPFDEIMDDDMQHIWLPILHDQPLIPIVYKQMRSCRFF